jgi:Phosphotransferase enzyme family
MGRSEPPDGMAPAGPDVDHVWGNLRVLLPPGRIPRACQLGGDRLAAHLARIADHVALVTKPARNGASETYDLVVVDDLARVGPDFPDALTDARRLCRPDGVVLVGSSSRLESAQIGRWVRSGGWSWLVVLPGPRRPAVALDPRDRLAADHFRRHLAFAYRPPGRRGPTARIVQVRNRLALLALGSAALRATPGRVALLAGDEARPSLLEELTGFVRGSWRDLELPGRAPDRLSPVVIAHRKTALAVVSVVLLGGEVPVVAKLPRYGRSSAAIRRESSNLDAVAGSTLGPIRETVPRPLGLHEIGGVEVHLQTGVTGRLLAAESARRLRPAALRRQLQLMFTWAARLQRASGRWAVVDGELIDERLVPLAEAAIRALDDDRRVRTLLERAIEHARALSRTPIRLGVAHGDLWAGNVLVEDGWISGIVDWERAALDELPIWDPVKAVLDTAYHLDRYRSIPRRGRARLPRWGDLGPWEGIADRRRAIGFRAAVADPSWLSELARDALISAFVDADIPVGWLPVAIPFHLVREFVHPDASERSVEGWGSVLRALAASPGTWADELVGDRRGARTAPAAGARGPKAQPAGRAR